MDDLMIFYEGNINSVSRVMEELTHFSAYSKQLSYTGRLQLIYVVHFSIHSFWSSVFILPLASWEQVCIPKNFGGLNIKGSKMWNMASVGRLLWQLAIKEDVLWIKLVHGVYMKSNDNIWLYTPLLDSSWYWKKDGTVKHVLNKLRRKNWQQFHKELIEALSEAMIYQPQSCDASPPSSFLRSGIARTTTATQSPPSPVSRTPDNSFENK
ncbi:hypothetical protein H5410_003781 [Solanum commersonii]|uniref:Uncharacterized protein n=1 Tax=Solanum commersonii TaxID=4109 RepID=A0A9J6B5Y8_SOLCO|nr:hypothetical protein H5410_003781 [Solanum commersonii]